MRFIRRRLRQRAALRVSLVGVVVPLLAFPAIRRTAMGHRPLRLRLHRLRLRLYRLRCLRIRTRRD